ncbi:hypothetical protein [Streptomyces kanamyceticus]|uniref:Uncharacterized protein n=1 Tax=Streptomyces kanamyceticus TaxID=1967 RepID=A0A5J6G490_STRKN|nr:hypothetical protein [Streptomyces kanamyceticus]QEU90450.1 hypothetical protein CP970_05565 [Streptomyces kanamyceticus]
MTSQYAAPAGRYDQAACTVCGCPGAGQCHVCGSPLDARVFDSSNVVAAPGPGEEVVLARFELPSTHCGLLQYFAQFTDLFARDPGRVATPGYQWQIRSDVQPLDPYLSFGHIINPWGLSGFPVDIRISEGAALEFTVRNTGASRADTLTEVGGRILGRHWYDTRFGGAPGLL